jgi:hypothetical protein
LLIEGYNNRIVHDYRNTRLIMYMMARMWGDPNKSPRTPEDLWELPGDEKKGQMSESEIAEMFKSLKQKNGTT